MMSPRSAGLRLVVAFCAAAALLSACGDGSGPDDGNQLEGSWSAVLEPPITVGSLHGCNRSIPYGILSMNDLGDFDLSVNTVDDCRSIGEDFVFGEIYHDGSYTRDGALLSFTTPEAAQVPLFTGTVEGDYIHLTLPPATGLASEDVELLVGPRQPF
jgi:hypothetical protein